MKKLRFLIAIVLIFSLLPVFGVSASEQTEVASETESYDFKKLEAFGLVSESDHLFYYENVMRSTFMSYIMKCFPGYSEAASVATLDNPFVDVKDTTDGFNAILMAANTGLVSGAKGSAFRPDDFITKSEAAKVFVSMLGYGDYAERKGGYPSGYLAMAKTLGIFDGCEFTPEEYFTIKGFLKAFGNVLDTDVLEVRSLTVGPDGKVISQEYESLEERTLLYYAFDIYKAKGIVEANEYASVLSKSDLKKDQVMINGYVYKINDDKATSLLGFNTRYYYKKDKEKVLGELVYIEPYETTVVETHTNNVVKDSVTATNFRYYLDDTSDKYRDLKIAKYTTLIHNGEQKPLTKELICPKNGTVTLIENDGDDIFDMIFVMDYRTIMISSVAPLTYQIMDSFGGPTVELDPESEEYDVVLEIKQPTGNSTRYLPSYGFYGKYLPPVKNEFSELKVGDIILFAESKNNNLNIKYAKVSRDTVEGTVSAIFDNYVLIDGKKYELSPDAKYTVSLGESGTFYLDVFGKIVTKSLEKKVVYGYLNGIDKSEDAFDTAIRLQIFTESNRWVILELANNVKTNILGDATTYSSLKPLAVYNALNAMPNFKQLITYSVTKEGKVNTITIARRFEAYSAEEKDAIEQDIFRKIYREVEWGNKNDECRVTSTDMFSDFGTAIGYEDILLDDTSKVFVICEDDPSLSKVEAKAQLSSVGQFIPYDINERRIAGAIVSFKKKSSFSASSAARLVFVEEVIKTTNINGEEVSGVVGICEGELMTFVASSASLTPAINKLSKGDIVQVALDKNGELYDNPPTDIDANATGSIKRRLDIKNKTLKPLDTTTDSSAYGQVCTVEFVDPILKQILVKGKDDKPKFIKITDSTKFFVYDTEKETVRSGAFEELSKGTFLFVQRKENKASNIVLYK